jgi:hypothetical protein
MLWDVLDEIRGRMNKDQVTELLHLNGTCGFKKLGIETHYELLADLIVFGGLPPCESCNNPTLRWNPDRHAYKCCSFITEYTRCSFQHRSPARIPFKASDEFLERFTFLAKYHDKMLLETGRLYSSSVENNEVSEIQVAQRRFAIEEESRRCIVKNGCTVDPKCIYAEECHVYIDENRVPWQALLVSAELESGKNSFYKLQLIKHDKRNAYYVFRR